MYEVAVIVPAYNEENTVGRVVEAFHRELPSAQIVVVDNGSTDGTRAVARAALQCMGGQGVVLNEPRRGKGNAVRRAFLDIDAAVYVLVDADMTYPAKQVHQLLPPVQVNEVDAVVGERFSRQQYRSSTNRPLHCFGNQLVRMLVNALFGGQVVDVMSGYRVLSRRFVKTYPILVDGFQLETEMTLHAIERRFRVAELPVDYFARPVGSMSKVRTLRDGLRVLSTVVRMFVHYRPLVFFAGFSTLLLLATLVSGAPVLTDWLRHGTVSHLQLAVAAAVLGMMALSSLAIGPILGWFAHQEKLAFEYHLQQMHRPGSPRPTLVQRTQVQASKPYVRAV